MSHDNELPSRGYCGRCCVMVDEEGDWGKVDVEDVSGGLIAWDNEWWWLWTMILWDILLLSDAVVVTLLWWCRCVVMLLLCGDRDWTTGMLDDEERSKGVLTGRYTVVIRSSHNVTVGDRNSLSTCEHRVSMSWADERRWCEHIRKRKLPMWT